MKSYKQVLRSSVTSISIMSEYDLLIFDDKHGRDHKRTLTLYSEFFFNFFLTTVGLVNIVNLKLSLLYPFGTEQAIRLENGDK